jgi:hypothetical protein
MKILLLLGIVFGATSGSAGERLFWDSERNSRIVVADSEELGVFNVDVFEKKGTTLQQRVSHQEFQSAEVRDRALQALLEKYNQTLVSVALPTTEPQVEAASAPTGIWVASETWDWNWEKKYAEWIRTETDESFLEKYNIPVDCADVIFAYRWIFSRMHHLPAGHQLIGGLDLLTHESNDSSWSSLSTAANWWEDKRFLASLAYLLANTYTHSLGKDSYPIQIDPESVTGGAFVLTLHSPQTGHTNLIQYARYGNPNDAAWIKWTFSRSGRPYLGPLMSQLGIYRREYPEAVKKDGYLRNRWLVKEGGVWKLVARDQMPYFSEEQYDPANFGGEPVFAKGIFKRLHKADPNPAIQFASTLNDVVSRLKVRVEIVEKGFKACAPNRCASDSAEYDEWSTPHRDQAIRDAFDAAMRVRNENPKEVEALWKARQKEVVVTIEGHALDLMTLNYYFQSSTISSDPNDSILKRWGL